jgi:hypothetical protein
MRGFQSFLFGLNANFAEIHARFRSAIVPYIKILHNTMCELTVNCVLTLV